MPHLRLLDAHALTARAERLAHGPALVPENPSDSGLLFQSTRALIRARVVVAQQQALLAKRKWLLAERRHLISRRRSLLSGRLATPSNPAQRLPVPHSALRPPTSPAHSASALRGVWRGTAHRR